MKRTLLMIMSILLAASSVFGIIAAGRGSDELSDIMRFKRGQKADIIDFVDVRKGLHRVRRDRSKGQ